MRSGYHDSHSEADEDLPDIDVIEQVAQTIVAQIRTMIDHSARYEAVDATDFPDRDSAYYDRTEQQLAVLGFQTLGDFEDASVVVTDAAMKSFVRFALGAHGAIAAMWFEVPNPQGDPLLCLVLHSWLADGRVLVTARGTIDSGLPLPAAIVIQRIQGDVDTKAAVRMHAERVAATGKAPRRLTGHEELFGRYASDERATSEFRKDKGAQLFEPLLRTMLGPNYDAQGEPILDAIQRHPEWMRGEISTGCAPLSVGVARNGEVDVSRFPHVVIARIPEHIEPMDRGARYEDPLQDALAIRDFGMVTGGGSQLTPAAEIAFVDVELALSDLEEALDVVKRILEGAGAPVGSQFLFEQWGADIERPFGVHEGLALYLDGTSLPDEVYQHTDVDALMERLAVAVDSVGGELRSMWNGPSETALYHFGPSADAMLDALQPVFDEFPICENARVVIRQGLENTRTVRVQRSNGA